MIQPMILLSRIWRNLLLQMYSFFFVLLAPLVPYTHIFFFFFSTLPLFSLYTWLIGLFGDPCLFFLFGRIPIQMILRHTFLSVLPSTVNFQTVIYKKKVLFCFQEMKLCNYPGIGLFWMLGNDGRESTWCSHWQANH